MRMLLESSWMRFGPAGRGSYDWVTGSPSTQEKQGFNWNELDLGEDRKTELVVYIVLPVVSVLLLALLVGLVYRRCSRSKLSLANIIALDLQDAESSAEFLSSLTRNAERHTSTSSDGSDGVFVMVYLPPPYEETLTKITRAASLSSSKDVESIKIEDLEAKLCPELKSSGRYV
ncbi:small integral membrane protein 28 [Enoplosus armatus]|uniref:small integral membrane protein 28 n=1 Tax=Enoplosus armatus TaxID=215367 RepID=UPI003993E32B